MNWRVFFFNITGTFLLFSTVLTAQQPSLIEQCRDYYSFKDYERTIELANTVLKDPVLKKDPEILEEAYYLINESAEEIRLSLQNRVNSFSADQIKEECRSLSDRLHLSLTAREDGYYYIIMLKHSALKKLLRLNPESEYIEKIKLRALLRLTHYNVDPLFRFQEDLRTVKLYNTYISNYPGSHYLPNLLMRTADLYFNLYEQAQTLQSKLGYSDYKVEQFYKKSKQLYSHIMKTYPWSDAASLIGEIRVDGVKLRKNPETKSDVIRKLKSGLLVKILERSDKRYSISNMYEYWYKVQLPDGEEGWMYGFYLDTSFIR